MVAAGIRHTAVPALLRSRLQLFAVPRGDSQAPLPISRVFDMSLLCDRVPLLCVAFQLHRLLGAVSKNLPNFVLQTDRDLVHDHKRANGTVAWTRTVTLESATLAALKSVRGWAALCEELGTSLEAVTAAYTCPAPLGGVVRAVMGPQLVHDTYTVRLKPLGLTGAPATPKNELELCAAAHGLLHGLAALHAARLVHRDVRWENVARSLDGNYFLIDLEACAEEGSAPTCRLRCWHSHTLEEATAGGGPARYTSASDMHLLGHLLSSIAEQLQPGLSPAGQAFLERLLQRDAGKRPSAAIALQDPWISCVGAACRVAGARVTR